VVYEAREGEEKLSFIHKQPWTTPVTASSPPHQPGLRLASKRRRAHNRRQREAELLSARPIQPPATADEGTVAATTKATSPEHHIGDAVVHIATLRLLSPPAFASMYIFSIIEMREDILYKEASHASSRASIIAKRRAVPQLDDAGSRSSTHDQDSYSTMPPIAYAYTTTHACSTVYHRLLNCLLHRSLHRPLHRPLHRSLHCLLHCPLLHF
jgi:hypothetical protein